MVKNNTAIHPKLRNAKITREVKELITEEILPQLPAYEINPFFAKRLEHTLSKPVVRIIDFDQAKQTRVNPDYYKTE